MDRRDHERLRAWGWLALSALVLMGAGLAEVHGRAIAPITIVAAFSFGWWAVRLLDLEGFR